MADWSDRHPEHLVSTGFNQVGLLMAKPGHTHQEGRTQPSGRQGPRRPAQACPYTALPSCSWVSEPQGTDGR